MTPERWESFKVVALVAGAFLVGARVAVSLWVQRDLDLDQHSVTTPTVHPAENRTIINFGVEGHEFGCSYARGDYFDEPRLCLSVDSVLTECVNLKSLTRESLMLRKQTGEWSKQWPLR